MTSSSIKQLKVSVSKIEKNPWNPNKQSEFMFEKERLSIRTFGFIDPCTVRTHPSKKGWYQMIDGEHRWLAAIEEGYTEVDVVSLGRISDAKARTLTEILNNLKGEQDSTLRGRLIQQILEEDETMRSLLPYGDDELKSILEAADFDWSALGEDNPGGKGGSSDGDDGESGWVSLKVSMTPEQHKVVSAAITAAKKRLKTDSDSEALTMICKAFPKP